MRKVYVTGHLFRSHSFPSECANCVLNEEKYGTHVWTVLLKHPDKRQLSQQFPPLHRKEEIKKANWLGERLAFIHSLFDVGFCLCECVCMCVCPGHHQSYESTGYRCVSREGYSRLWPLEKHSCVPRIHQNGQKS